MSKVTITLELDYHMVSKVMAFLTSQETSLTEPTSPKLIPEDKVPAPTLKEPIQLSTAPVKTPGKKTAMPSFGRTKEQVTAYIETKQERLDEREEEALIKAQRAEERAAKQSLKDIELQEKLEEEQREQAVIDSILKTKENDKLPSYEIAKPIWFS